jgi:hypothetical protein
LLRQFLIIDGQQVLLEGCAANALVSLESIGNVACKTAVHLLVFILSMDILEQGVFLRIFLRSLCGGLLGCLSLINVFIVTAVI